MPGHHAAGDRERRALRERREFLELGWGVAANSRAVAEAEPGLRFRRCSKSMGSGTGCAKSPAEGLRGGHMGALREFLQNRCDCARAFGFVGAH